MKYVLSAGMTDVSDALHALLALIDARLPQEARADQADFRTHCCYLQEVDVVLRKHEASLRALHGGYSFTGDLNAAAKLQSAKAMDFEDWGEFCKDFDLFDEFGLLHLLVGTHAHGLRVNPKGAH
eukprot:7383452-Prymnesium_polylepis.2